MQKDGQKLWGDILNLIKLKVSSSTFKTWFAGSHVVEYKTDVNRKLLIIGLKNNFLKEQVETRYQPIISELRESNGYEDVELEFVVANKAQESVSKSAPLFSGEPQRLSVSRRKLEDLNPNYTFDSFVVGSTNNLAHVAATQVADSPGSSYNPLLFYGPTGVGKTHLLHSVGNKLIDISVEAKVLYVTSEKFTNDYIQSLNNKTQQSFRQKYRTIDLLLIDDIQFLAGKESTQDEFFHCFNELALIGKQIVVASDKHPKELGRLKERLVSRFLGGMIVDIGYPDLEMKMAIIKKKSKDKNIFINDSLVEYIAKESHGGARELEGVLTATMAKIKLSGGKFDLEDIKRLLNKNQSINKIAVSPGKIISIICKKFRVDEANIKSASRKAKLVKVRQILVYMLRRELGLSLESIGDLVGGRDHSTIIYSVDKVEKQVNDDISFRDEILRIKTLIHS